LIKATRHQSNKIANLLVVAILFGAPWHLLPASASAGNHTSNLKPPLSTSYDTAPARNTAAGRSYRRFIWWLRKKLGVEIRPVNKNAVKHWHRQSPHGYVITRVDPGGPLGRTGIEVNDIILEINGRPITNVKDIRHIISGIKKNGALILLTVDHRTGRMGYIEVQIPQWP